MFVFVQNFQTWSESVCSSVMFGPLAEAEATYTSILWETRL